MANIRIVFCGSHQSKTEQHELECFHNQWDEITFSIQEDGYSFISIDKSTAIKLVKTLKTEISKIEEGSNG